MKKIRSPHSDSDRVICRTTLPDKYVFYYQPLGGGDRMILFETPVRNHKDSVFQYFSSHGRRETDGFSICLRQLYQFRDYHNKKLTKIVQKLPLWIDELLRSEACEAEATVSARSEKPTFRLADWAA